METNAERESQSQNSNSESQITEPLRTEIFVAPGVPVVRGNTPKPLSMRGDPSSIEQSQVTQSSAQSTTSALSFPLEAPVAPPLPEESEGVQNNAVHAAESSPQSHSSESNVSGKAASEFVWLFEYGLEMNPSVLNGPNRLNGLALLYGPAVLKGYRLTFNAVDPRSGKVVANIRPDSDPRAAVWGILYRIPRRLTERGNGELSILDRLHHAAHFESREVVVQDAYRKRDIRCTTYIASASARQQFQLLPKERQVIDTAYIHHLLACARQQKLPGEYLAELVQFSATNPEYSIRKSNGILSSMKNDTPGATNDRSSTHDLAVEVQPKEVTLPVEQNTEPLPVLSGKAGIVSPKSAAQRELQPTASSRWLMAFALYLVLLFLIVLALSVLQALGFGSNILTASFAPLGTPWFVLVYGLLGGCVSGIITMSRSRPENPPGFVVITWFTRPFIAAVLAALAYLALNSGFFVVIGTAQQHYALFSLVGVLAGLCERWVFFRHA